jgi:uncharacterized OsmC-like protein
MNADQLRALQAPLKASYRDHPQAAQITLRARGRLGEETVACKVDTGTELVTAGLHPASGGDGSLVCSGDMLLEALVACAGVTLKAVATALSVPLASGEVVAEGDLDFRGTLGVSKEVPVGFSAIRLRFDLQTTADQATIDKLLALTERYCVVYQTLRNSPQVAISVEPIQPKG